VILVSVVPRNGIIRPRYVSYAGQGSYLSDAPNVLVPVLLRESQVLVEAEAHIVAVEPVRGHAEVEQVLLERRRDR